MGQILEWLTSVMLGVIAAPFLAFAHFDTDGEGLGQKTQHGYGFMLQSFIREL
jgi:conjugal transfer/type IV secretion protein DotA/TraY